MTEQVDTSTEAVERLALWMETDCEADGSVNAAATLRALAGERDALEIIANRRQCIDNLLGDKDVARAALAQEPKP